MTRGDRGQALVETALVLPLVLILLVGIFDLGRAAFLSGTLNHAVREGTRYAIVHGALSTQPSGPGSPTYVPPDNDTAVTAAVERHMIGLPAPLTVQSTWPDGNSYRGSQVIVTGSFLYTPVLSAAFLGGGLQVTLRSSSRLAIEQ